MNRKYSTTVAETGKVSPVAPWVNTTKSTETRDDRQDRASSIAPSKIVPDVPPLPLGPSSLGMPRSRQSNVSTISPLRQKMREFESTFLDDSISIKGTESNRGSQSFLSSPTATTSTTMVGTANQSKCRLSGGSQPTSRRNSRRWSGPFRGFNTSTYLSESSDDEGKADLSFQSVGSSKHRFSRRFGRGGNDSDNDAIVHSKSVTTARTSDAIKRPSMIHIRSSKAWPLSNDTTDGDITDTSFIHSPTSGKGIVTTTVTAAAAQPSSRRRSSVTSLSFSRKQSLTSQSSNPPVVHLLSSSSSSSFSRKPSLTSPSPNHRFFHTSTPSLGFRDQSGPAVMTMTAMVSPPAAAPPPSSSSTEATTTTTIAAMMAPQQSSHHYSAAAESWTFSASQTESSGDRVPSRSTSRSRTTARAFPSAQITPVFEGDGDMMFSNPAMAPMTTTK